MVRSSSNYFELGLLVFRFFSVYVSCILTPIGVFIFQSYSLHTSVAIILIFCDIILFVEFFIFLLSNAYRVPNCMKRYTFAVFLFFSFSSIYIIPILIVMGLKSNIVIWLSLIRLFSIILIPDLYNTAIHHIHVNYVCIDRVVNRLIVALFGFVMFSSFAACIWFYNACNNATGCVNDNSWTAHDSILNMNDYDSRYLRSLHFIMQTLFTIG